MQECQDKLQELRDAERDMIVQKLQNILDYYDKIQNYFDSVLGKLESRISAKNAWGQRTDFSDLIEEYATTEDSLANAVEKQFAYQTGLVKENVRESVDIIADIWDDKKPIESTKAYEDALQRRENLNAKNATWNDAKNDIAFLKKYKNKYQKGNLSAELRAQFEDILAEYNTEDAAIALTRAKQKRDENKWTQKDKNALAATEKELLAFSSILQNTTDYYDQATERSKELSEKDKLKKAEQKEKTGLDEDIQTMQALDNPYLSKWYTDALQTKEQLEAKKAPVQEQMDRIAQLNDLINNETDKWQRNQYIKERDALQKQVNKVWKQKDDKLLTNVTRQLQAVEDIKNQVVDNEVASTATYQNLLKQIGDLKSKKTLTPEQQNKLTMLLEEMREINSGVLAEDITTFNTAYQAWWKQNQKELTLENHTQQWQNKEAKWKALQQKFQERQSELQKELDDALVVEGEKEADLTTNFERTVKELKKSYGAQLDEAQNGFENSAVYKQFKKSYETNKSNYEKLYTNKGREQTAAAKKLKATIEQQEKQLAEMRAGATQENFEEYWEAIKWLDNHRTAHDNGTLGSLASTWDKYEAKVNAWKKAKQEEVDAIQKEMDDKIAEVTNEYETNVAKNEQEINERHEKLGEIAKQLAEFEVSTIQREIEKLEGLINQAESIAHMLENTSFSALSKYPNIMEFLGLDSSKNLTELLTDQLSTAITATTEKIEQSASLASMYQELIDSATSGDGGFAGIFAKYREGASEETKKIIDRLVNVLNEADFSDSTWITEWENAMAEAINETVEGIEKVQELKDEFRENVVFRAINNALEQLNSLQSKLGSMANVINDDWVMAGDSITEYGLAKIYMIGEQMKTAQEQTAQWGAKIKEINDIIAGGNALAAYGSEEEAMNKLNEATEQYYASLQSVETYAYQAYQLAQRAREAEVNEVKKAVEAYKKLLNQKKMYYDYSRNIEKQNKSVQDLQSQINALNGINTAEAKAQQAQLRAQLEDAQDQLRETQMQHQFDLETSALDNMISRMEEALSKTADDIDKTFEHFAETIKNLLSQAENSDVTKAYTTVAEFLMGLGRKVGLEVIQPIIPTTTIIKPEETTYAPVEPTGTEQYVPIDFSTYVNGLQTLMKDSDTVLQKISELTESNPDISRKILIDSYVGMKHLLDTAIVTSPHGDRYLNITFADAFDIDMSNEAPNIRDQYNKFRDAFINELKKNGYTITHT